MAFDFVETSDAKVSCGNTVASKNNMNAGGGINVWAYIRSDGQANLGRIWQRGGNLQTEVESVGNIAIHFHINWSTVNGIWNSAVDFPLDQWVSLSMNYDGSDVTNDPDFYFDNTQSTTGEASTPEGTVNDNGSLFIGNANANTRDYDGGLSYFTFYTTELTSQQRQSLANGVNPFVVVNSTLVGCYPFDSDDLTIGRNYFEGESATAVANIVRFPGNPPIELLENYL
jgi:hypothetical protein